MKTNVERLTHLDTDAVWSDGNAPKKGLKKDLPGVKPFIVAAIATAVVVLAGVVKLCFMGMQAMHALAAQIGDIEQGGASQSVTDAVTQVGHWVIWMALAGVAGMAAVLFVAVAGCLKLRTRWELNHMKMKRDSDERAHKFLGQLADSRVSEEEARKAQAETETRLNNLLKSHVALEKQLEERRQVEKNLAQQTQQLERSKDVLEMHVQARTTELQKLQRRNELILNSAGDGICGFDLQGRATFVNPSAARLTGYKLEDVLGKSEEAIFYPSKTRGADVPGLLMDDEGNAMPEQTFYRKDGSSFPVEYVRTPIKEGDRVVGAVVMFKDITERRVVEERLGRKASELARSNRELEQFAFVASHDLQEPLRKIQAFGDRLKAKCESVQLEEGRDYLERMQSAAARMQNLINDLLTFSRVISSSQPFLPVDLKAVTQEVLLDLECRIEQTRATVHVGDLPTIEGDSTQMRQLLQNLLGNALKFQAPGSAPDIKVDAQVVKRGDIKEEACLPKTPTASPEDPFCVLTVKDNGIGFEEQYLEKVFAVFQRLHGRGEYEGTGVGLAVCRRITERHGGYITAQSKPGEGSTFIVILPLQAPNVETPQ